MATSKQESSGFRLVIVPNGNKQETYGARRKEGCPGKGRREEGSGGKPAKFELRGRPDRDDVLQVGY